MNKKAKDKSQTKVPSLRDVFVGEILYPKDQSMLLSEASIPQIQQKEQPQCNRDALGAMLDLSAKVADLQSKTVSVSRSLVFDDGVNASRLRLKAAKDARLARKAALTNQQRFVLETAAEILNIPLDLVLEGVYDSDFHIDLLESLCAQGGRGCVVVCEPAVEKQERPRTVQIQQSDSEAALSQDVKAVKTYLSDASTVSTLARSVAIYRIKNNKEIDVKTVADDFFYAYFDMNPCTSNVVKGIITLLERIYLPNVEAFQNWGDLNPPNPKSRDCINYFIIKLKHFLDYLKKIREDLECCFKFPVNALLYKERLSTPEKMQRVLTSKKTMEEICRYVKKWLKTMQWVLVRSQQIRCEPSNMGPKAELDYWRRQLISFTSIVEHFNSPIIKAYIEPLIQAKSKLIKKWNELGNEVINFCNEAADNVKYLNALDGYCEPLYRCDPTALANHIPSLLYTVRMIFTSSAHYNTTNQISTLLIKVTNQILVMCLDYLTNKGQKTIWNQSKYQFIEKAKVCLSLYEVYKREYEETQEAMRKAPDERPFECSIVFIFGKFETFKSRLLKIIDLFKTYIKYNVLKFSTIDGIEEHANMFDKFYKTISQKSYDALDHRKGDFDKDYQIYKENVAKQELLLEQFMISSMANCPTTDIALLLLHRFEKLQLDCLYYEDAYWDLCVRFTKEVEALRDSYNSKRMKPELPRNMTPIAGRIFWIRFYFDRISEPMAIFEKHEEVITHPEMQRLIKIYNALILVFTEYEIVYHQSWIDNIVKIEANFISLSLAGHLF